MLCPSGRSDANSFLPFQKFDYIPTITHHFPFPLFLYFFPPSFCTSSYPLTIFDNLFWMLTLCRFSKNDNTMAVVRRISDRIDGIFIQSQSFLLAYNPSLSTTFNLFFYVLFLSVSIERVSTSCMYIQAFKLNNRKQPQTYTLTNTTLCKIVFKYASYNTIRLMKVYSRIRILQL